MPGGELRIRAAGTGDAWQLAAVQVRSWQVAMRGVFPSGFLEGLRPEDRVAAWRHTLSDPARTTLLADEQGRVLGFVLIGAAAQERETVGEVLAIYVLPEEWRHGIGGALIRAAEEEMVARGFREAVLWVLESNTAARAFYAATGWAEDGARRRQPAFGVQAEELRCRRRLGEG